MVKHRDPKLRRASAYGIARRIPRSPKHPFQLRTRPFQIQPFMLSPVLPGETLKNLVLQSRVVSKPLVHPLIGWWCEYYFFYVKLRDIEYHLGSDFVTPMVTTPGSYNPAPLRAAADAKYYHAGGNTPWIKYAMGTCVEYFFRDEGENWNDFLVDGVPLAQFKHKSWMDSLTLDENRRVALAGHDYDLDANADGKISAQEVEYGMQHWQALRDAGLETLDYEDWIRTFGVQVEEEPDSFNERKPEMIRYWSQWQYPTNTVDPSNGTPRSAVSFVNAFRADKDRLFKEPGFIIGLTIQRPKVYIKDAKGSLAGFMETLENWMPALSHEQYEKAFKRFDGNAGPMPNRFGTSPYKAYWVDFRDLLVHGDQFLNFAPDAASSALNFAAASGKTRYPTAADIDTLFVDPAKNYFESDGVVDVTIMGRQRDRTPGQNVL